nr:MAG TPA: hypothetical protein [Caudoviricetes sp.]
MYLKSSLAVIAFLLYASLMGFHGIAPYNALRWITFIYCGYAALYWCERKVIFIWIFSTMAIIINPVFKFHMQKSNWQVIDIIFSIIIVASIFYAKKQKENQ